MSKFGMSGTGIQIGQAATAAPEATDAERGGAGARLRRAWRQLVFDANDSYFYRWNALVSTAYVYNLLVR